MLQYLNTITGLLHHILHFKNVYCKVLRLSPLHVILMEKKNMHLHLFPLISIMLLRKKVKFYWVHFWNDAQVHLVWNRCEKLVVDPEMYNNRQHSKVWLNRPTKGMKEKYNV